MDDYVYFAQVKSNAGIWISLGITSISLDEVNKAISGYIISHPKAEVRVVQRLAKENIAKMKKIPGCC